MRRAISVSVILLVASLFICGIVCAQPERIEKIKAEIFQHRQAIERLKAQLVAMGVTPPVETVVAVSDVVTTTVAPITKVIVPPRIDKDDNPPGPAGGPGTNRENPPGPKGGPGASPHRPSGRR
jgi:hypothetical protein